MPVQAGAELELHGAIVQALLGAAAVTALVAQRIYDRPPGDPAPQLPYVVVADLELQGGYAECLVWDVLQVSINVFSDEPGLPEAMRIGRALRDALHDANLQLATNNLTEIKFQSARYGRDVDGLGARAAVVFRARAEPSA